MSTATAPRTNSRPTPATGNRPRRKSGKEKPDATDPSVAENPATRANRIIDASQMCHDAEVIKTRAKELLGLMEQFCNTYDSSELHRQMVKSGMAAEDLARISWTAECQAQWWLDDIEGMRWLLSMLICSTFSAYPVCERPRAPR